MFNSSPQTQGTSMPSGPQGQNFGVPGANAMLPGPEVPIDGLPPIVTNPPFPNGLPPYQNNNIMDKIGGVVGGISNVFQGGGGGGGRDTRSWGSQSGSSESTGWQPALDAAQTHLNTRMYQQNPHLDKMADVVGDRADLAASMGGRYGSGAHAGHVARAIAPLYQQDWNRQNQDAMQAISSFGNLQRTNEQRGYWDQASKGAIQPVRNILGNMFGGGGGSGATGGGAS